MSENNEDLIALFSDCPFAEWEAFPRRCAKRQTVWSEPVDAWVSYLPDRERTDPLFVKWLWERGYLIHVVPAIGLSKSMQRASYVMQLTPKIQCPSATECFHATPLLNAEGIEQRGLLPGRECGESATGRLDASHYIHVSLTLTDAREWATKERLLSIGSAAVFRVDPAAAGLKLFRDPFSRTGYILDAFHVADLYIRRVA